MSTKITLTPASSIGIRAVRWLWSGFGDRIPLGELVLLAGREGSGKSTLDCWLTAQVTTGRLPGHLHGQPRSVLVAATEDDWSTTIVPRLMVAGADLDRVFRVDVAVDDREGSLSLPDDLDALEDAIAESHAAMLVLSPLISRLSRALDSYKDAEVRQGLEALVAIAQRHECTVLGLIHLNKQGGSDPLRAIMASTAFPAVARAVLFVQRDAEDQSIRVLGQPKNQHGLIDPEIGGMPQFTIEAKGAGRDPSGEIVLATRVRWLTDKRPGTIASVVDDDPTARALVDDAADWLEMTLADAGGELDYKAIEAAARKNGINPSTLKRARAKVGSTVENTATFPRRTLWRLPGAVHISRSGAVSRRAGPTGPTGPTASRSETSKTSQISTSTHGPTADEASFRGDA